MTPEVSASDPRLGPWVEGRLTRKARLELARDAEQDPDLKADLARLQPISSREKAKVLDLAMGPGPEQRAPSFAFAWGSAAASLAVAVALAVILLRPPAPGALEYRLAALTSDLRAQGSVVEPSTVLDFRLELADGGTPLEAQVNAWIVQDQDPQPIQLPWVQEGPGQWRMRAPAWMVVGNRFGPSELRVALSGSEVALSPEDVPETSTWSLSVRWPTYEVVSARPTQIQLMGGAPEPDLDVPFPSDPRAGLRFELEPARRVESPPPQVLAYVHRRAGWHSAAEAEVSIEAERVVVVMERPLLEAEDGLATAIAFAIGDGPAFAPEALDRDEPLGGAWRPVRIRLTPPER